MKLRYLLILPAMMLAACVSEPTIDDIDDDGDFVAGDIAPDARPGNAHVGPRERLMPLTSDEEAQAALLVTRLEVAEDQATRDNLLGELVALGPRYLNFFRSIERDSLALDMMFVIRRIEREHEIRNEEKEPAYKGNGDQPDPEIERSAGPDARKETPEYPPGSDDYDRAEVERFLAARLTQARRMLDTGNHQGAIRIAEAAITLLPDTRLRPDFEALIVSAKGESQAELLIAGSITLEPANLTYARQEKSAPFKEPLMIQCYLKNVSLKPITLLLYQGEGRESILQLALSYEQTDYQGNVMTQRGNVRLPIDAGESITLQPNESYAMGVPLEGLASLDADAPLKSALGNVRVDAALRVYGARDDEGKTLVLRPIQFPIRTIRVFPAAYDLEKHEARPLTAMRKFIKDGAAQDLFLTAHLIGRREKRNAGDTLLGDDFDDSTLAMKRARLKCLNVVFNTGANWDIKQWREWWKDNRLRQ